MSVTLTAANGHAMLTHGAYSAAGNSEFTPEGLDAPGRVLGARISQQAIDHHLWIANHVTFVSMCLSALSSQVFEKTPHLERGSGEGATLIDDGEDSDGKDFSTFYNSTLSQFAREVERAIVTLGVVPVRFVREERSSRKHRRSRPAAVSEETDDDDYGDDSYDDYDDYGDGVPTYVSATVPRTHYGIWRYYDIEKAKYVYVLLRPKAGVAASRAGAVGTDALQMEVDPDGMVLTGFGYDPDNAGALCSMVAHVEPLVVKDMRFEASVMHMQDAISRPIMLLERKDPVTSSQGLDADGVKYGQRLTNLAYMTRIRQEHSVEEMDAVAASEAEYNERVARREREIERELPLTPFEAPLDYFGGGGGQSASGYQMQPLPPGMHLVQNSVTNTLPQFAAVSREFKRNIAAGFGLPLDHVMSEEHRTVASDTEGKQRMLMRSVKKLRTSVAMVLTVVYRVLRAPQETKRLMSELQSNGTWSVVDTDEVARLADRNAPTVRFADDAEGSFEMFGEMYERGVLSIEGMRALTASMYNIPREFLSTEEAPPAVLEARAMAEKQQQSALTLAKSKTTTAGASKGNAKAEGGSREKEKAKAESQRRKAKKQRTDEKKS